MIRIAFDIHTIGQRATGNETYSAGLLRAFQDDPQDDMELYYYHFDALEHANLKGRFRRLWPRWPYARIPLTTPYFLARDRIDAAHFQYIAPPLSPCATVLTVHDLSYERYPEFFSPAMSARMRLLMPYMTRRATQIITVSQATRDDLVEFYKIAPERITVIHNGAPQGFQVMAGPERARDASARLALERPFILCVGNLGARKNQRLLVRVFARLIREQSIEHDLVLVGKHTESAKPILDEIHRQGIGDRVHVTGYATQQELVALYNLATFSVYPSRYEGFGLPILESMACGTPVITSAVSCMPEIAGDAALLIDPQNEDALFDAMYRLLESESLRARLRHAGLERCKQFSWAEAARRTFAVYRTAIAG